jgi:hypothetical protein
MLLTKLSLMSRFLFAVILFAAASRLSAQAITTKETAKGKALEYYTQADNDIAFNKIIAADSLLRLAVKEKRQFY